MESHYRYLLVLAAALLAASACSSFSSALPAPCANDSTTYTIADRARGLQLPQPHGVVVPRGDVSPGLYEVRLLVSVRGTVDSVEVRTTADQRSAASIARSAASYRFQPATLSGCAVRAWFPMSIER